MSWFTQNPWPVLIGGIASAAGCFLLAARTGNRRWLHGIGIAILVAALAVLGDWLIVTDYEAIDAMLESARAAVEANSAEGVVAQIDPQANAMREQVRRAMGAVVISDAHIGDLEIVVDDGGQTARADFLGNVQARDRSGQSPYDRFIRRFEIQLRKRDGRWWMTGMEMRDPIGNRPQR